MRNLILFWRLKKYKLYAYVALIMTAIVTVIALIMVLIMLFATQTADCWNDDQTVAQAGKGIGGDWQDKNSNTYKAMRHAADRFQKELHMSGDNIAAALAIGLRESGFNPKAVNPSGAVKGIWQWGAGGVNGNRYHDTQDTVESQVQLAINELKSSHKATLMELATANNINSSLAAWDTKFEGVNKNDPQRKVSDTDKTATKIKQVFGLDFPGSINIFDSGTNSAGVGDTSTNSNASALKDAACDTGLSSNNNGLPIKGKYNITGGYPNYGGLTGTMHYGVDFQTVDHDISSAGGNVYAVHDGKVVAKSSDNIGGNWVVIQGTDNVFTYYGHAPSQEAIIVNNGDHVKAGQHISHQGQTGMATGIHVHFAVNTHDQMGWAPQSKGLKSAGEYLKLPKKAGTNVVVPSGPFNSDK
ncbi:peptidoglycan DD-metalloendopeptidase family protein [Leuconostoc citreum]|uniref:phage tail tip lysozyme n=1 Tax=Leuconostoc citreum TaxID=33964 RepID=UPI00200B54C0|nr:phage tail tip lysozyme [Leuconostoc citreum]MCK8605671.1 peptidoglycan DD-metalloendopeptidase family protein [Leuconostoc citreum]